MVLQPVLLVVCASLSTWKNILTGRYRRPWQRPTDSNCFAKHAETKIRKIKATHAKPNVVISVAAAS